MDHPAKIFISLLGVTLLLATGFYLLDPIPQLQSYHHFADQRSWLGIPNTWNVLSNICIALPGIWGLFLLLIPKKLEFNHYSERWLWIGVSLGLILTALGSGYYHLDPDNSRLVWDRIPMAFTFMTLVAALIGERVNIYLGLLLWPVLVAVGIYSVLFWYFGELQGRGDLRFYIGVQVFAILVATIMLFSLSPYDRNQDLALVILFYVLAVLFDRFDHQIQGFFGDIISGHTLKHVFVGLAGAWLIRMIYKRKRKRNI